MTKSLETYPENSTIHTHTHTHTHKIHTLKKYSSFNILIEKGIKDILKLLYLHIGNLYRLPEGHLYEHAMDQPTM